LISLYPDVDVYTRQLRALENFTKAHPESADAHFVLAYQYMSQGENTVAATRQFEDVVKLVPNDQVSRQMLAMIAPSAAQPQDRVPETSPTASDEKQPTTAPQTLVGNWKAPASGGGTIELSLADGGRFKWTYARPGKSQSFDGKYELAGTTLVLEYDNGGTMVGKINAEGPNQFLFKMIGSPQSDSGLAFSK
jgi:hypothetical protein